MASEADDIKTLREAQWLYELDASRESNGNRNLVYRTNAILCRVVSDLMAGEGEKADCDMCDSHGRCTHACKMDAAPTPSSGEFERGWNAALESANDIMLDHMQRYEVCRGILNFAKDRIRALRKPAQGEGK